MRTTDLSKPTAEFVGPFGATADTLWGHPLGSAGDGGQAPVEDDVTSHRAAVAVWAVESGLTMSDFQQSYVDQCVADLLDQHPAMRCIDAERLVLSTTPWLDDRAA
jgi:hypothetical protein